jgi:thiamine-monophosphate kinase
MKLSEIGEVGLIERLASAIPRGGEGLIRGIGDDAAVIAWPAGELLLATCDTLIDGVHFCGSRRIPDLPEAGCRAIGRRLATVNLSDVAAMGGRPRFALVSLAAPPDTEVEALEELYAGLAAALGEAGAVVAGGNTARAVDRLAVDVCLLGGVEPSRLLTRDGARPGDVLCVTGDLGAAAAGLRVLEAAAPGAILAGAAREVALRHLAPTPRLAAGRILGASGSVTACIDVSDGLLRDAGHLARASRLGIRIDAEVIPVCDATRQACAAAGIDPLALALAGGEDYELLCTVRPEGLEDLNRALAAGTGLGLTVVGAATPGTPEALVLRGGEPWRPDLESFEHFPGSRPREAAP